MIGIILAAGEGSRLGRGTKALVPLGRRRLIDYPIQMFFENGVCDMTVVVNDVEVVKHCNDTYPNANFRFVSQPERRGIVDAVLRSGETDDEVVLTFCDVIYLGNGMKRLMNELDTRPNLDVVFGMKYVKDKARICESFGIVKGTAPPKIVEKPTDTFYLSPLLGLGLYYYRPAFVEVMKNTPVSPLTNVAEITEALNIASRKLKCEGVMVEGAYFNINTPKDLEEAEKYLKLHDMW